MSVCDPYFNNITKTAKEKVGQLTTNTEQKWT